MGIDIIIRPRSATSGGEPRNIDGEGTIDTRDEAVAALAVMGNGDNVVIVGSDQTHPFDRDSLQRIKDGGGSGSSASPTGLHIDYLNIPQNFPEGSRLFLFLDGNPAPIVQNGVERPFVSIQADRRIDVRIPAATPDGEHQVEYRIQRPNRSEARLSLPAIHISPAMATLTNASVLPPPAGRGGRPGTSFASDPIKVRFTTSLAAEHRVRVNVGNHTEIITVPAGAAGRQFDATLSGQPKTWTDAGGIPDRNRNNTVAVSVTPLGSGDRVGTTVNAGNVTISQPRAHGGGGSSSSSSGSHGGPPTLGGRR